MFSEKRFVIIGTSCTGKSTLAKLLAKRASMPCIELDELFWGPDWQPKEPAEFARLVAQATQGERWIAEGNYKSVRDTLWSRATTIVWLNYSLQRVLWQALKRTLRRSITRETLWHGNVESVRRSFLSKESILLWVLSTHRQRTKDFEELRASNKYNHLEWVELRNPSETRQWIASVASVNDI